MVVGRQGQAAVRRLFHSSPAEAAAQQRAEVLEDRLAADDEDPGIHDGVEGVEAEGGQVLLVTAERADRVDEAGDLRKRGVNVRSLAESAIIESDGSVTF